MQDVFLDHEEKFECWKKDGYPDTLQGTKNFIENLFHKEKNNPMWSSQKEGILRTIYAYEKLEMTDMLLNIVTGGGKTAIIAAIIFWLKTVHKVNKFLILSPNTIVRARLQSDFIDSDNNAFQKFQIFDESNKHILSELGLHVMEPNAQPQGMIDSGIILGNIHQLYRTNYNGIKNLNFIKEKLGKIAVFNDEAHNTPAEEYTSILRELSDKSILRLDTTATPDRADEQEPDTSMIYRYDIIKAIDDNIIKRIIVYKPSVTAVKLTYTNPDTKEVKDITELDAEFEAALKGIKPMQWILDIDPLRKQIKIAVDRHNEQIKIAKGVYKPVLFIVSSSIREGERIKDVLERQFDLKALLVTEESDEIDRDAAMKIGTFESDYDAVVSVMMLREGWDVPEVSTILLLRKFSSMVYGQQIIGRGLRKIIKDPERIEYLSVVDHPVLDHDKLWTLLGVSQIKRGVEDDEIFDETSNLPVSNQYLKNAELLIDIPEPTYTTTIPFDELRKNIPDDLIDENWEDTINNVSYKNEMLELSKIRVDAVDKIDLKQNILEKRPGISGTDFSANADLSKNEYVEYCKDIFMERTRLRVVENGYTEGVVFKVYEKVMAHIQKEIFFDVELTNNDLKIDLIKRAIRFENEIMDTFTDSVIRGIIEKK